MSDKSAAELERDAEIARAMLASTADSIRSKMTPGQLFDELTGIFAGGDLSSMMNNLRRQVRDNPLPLTMVGAGLAWLMLGKGTSAEGPSSSTRTDDIGDGAGVTDLFGYDQSQSDGSGLGEASSRLGDKLSEAADSMASAVAGVTDTAASAASSAKSTLTGTAGLLGSGAAQASRSAQDLLQSEPLAVAAVGLVLGTVIGAMLPPTQTEDEQVGAYNKELRDSARQAFEQGLETAKGVASEAYVAGKEEADRQSSDSGSQTLAGKAEKVARSTAIEAEEAIRDRLPTSGQDSGSAS